MDYVEGFDVFYTENNTLNDTAREKLEGAVKFADKVLGNAIVDEPSLFSPDTTFTGGSPLTAKVGMERGDSKSIASPC